MSSWSDLVFLAFILLSHGGNNGKIHIFMSDLCPVYGQNTKSVFINNHFDQAVVVCCSVLIASLYHYNQFLFDRVKIV